MARGWMKKVPWRRAVQEMEQCLCDECVAACPERAARRKELVDSAVRYFRDHVSEKQGGRNAKY